ncbi:DNA polymerase epsilon catalytic subunit A [Tanacetum coccineum]
MDDDDDSCTPSVTTAAGEIFNSCMTEYLREQIRSHYTQKLFRIVTDLLKRDKGKSDALELIKHVCVVFELDKNVAYKIQITKTNLLKIIKVREFSSEAEFKRCSFSFALPNMFCSPLVAEHYKCAGSFTLKKEVSIFRKEMAMLLKIAARQKFELLKECVSWILELDSIDQACVDE